MANEWVRKTYSGGAGPTTLNGGINNSVTSIAVTSGASFPDGSTGPFVITVDRTTLAASEEKMLCTLRSGNTLTVQRGYDGTTAVSHLTLASIEHVGDAWSFDQSNAHAAAASTVGQISYRSGALAYAAVTPGTSGLPLTSTGALAAPAYAALSAAGLASDSVTTVKIPDSNVTTAKIADSNVTTAKIADRNITGAKIAGSKWRRTSNLVVAVSTNADIPWEVEDFDDLGTTLASTTITIGTAGHYSAAYQVTLSASGSSGSGMNLRVNGATTVSFGTAGVSGVTVARGGGAAWLAAGDVLTANFASTSGGGNTITGAILHLTYLGG